MFTFFTWLVFVLVNSGCCDKYHRLVAYKQQSFTLTVLESGNPKSGCQHGHVTLFWITDFLLYLHRAEGGEASLGALMM